MGGFQLITTDGGATGLEEHALGDLWYFDLTEMTWHLFDSSANFDSAGKPQEYLSCDLSSEFTLAPRWGAFVW
jgi:hypothetical protein